MKKTFTFLLSITTFLSFAQPPAGYYNAAQGLTGFELKTALYTIISTSHNPQTYSSHWAFFETADMKPNGQVWDIYSNCPFEFGVPSDGGNQDIGLGGNIECEYFNREHSFPTSWFGGNIEPMRTDVVHIYPVDKKVNGERGNLAFANVGSATFTSTNGSKRGSSITSGISGNVFEIVDEYKGDIARTIFYMATRYENLIASWESNNADGDKMLDGSSNRVFEQWALDLLYSWHILDPVSAKEQARNNAIYNFQNNRNPYVDNPQWVQDIWANHLSINVASDLSYVSIYPNPSKGDIIIEGIENVEEIELITINGQIMQVIRKNEIQNDVIELKNLPKGFFLVKLKNGSDTTVKKIIIN